MLPLFNRARILAILFLIANLVTASYCQAASKKVIKRRYSPPKASLVVDGHTGEILHSSQAILPRHPASLTKLMTVYLTFEALAQKKITPATKLKVSRHVANQPSFKLGLRRGEYVTVKDALLATIIRSANDSAVLLAEKIAGSEKKFALKMNQKARKLGMMNSHFVNASGLHHKKQKSTAMDMARLAIALKRDFPIYYSLFSLTSFKFKGKTITGHNQITANYPGAEGLKTGYVRASGFNLVSSVNRDNKYLVGVVLGGNSADERNAKMWQLLDKHYGVVVPVNNKIKISKKTRKKKIR